MKYQKKYFFLTTRINEVGGAHTYIFNKSRTLINEGWDVYVIYGENGNIIIPFNSEGIKTLYSPHINFAPQLFPKRRISKTIDEICSFIGFGNYRSEIIIESTSDSQALWGEILAKKTSAKHIVFLLQEHNPMPLPISEFFRFKDARGELYGISNESMDELYLKCSLHTSPKILTAIGCAEVVSNINTPLVSKIEQLRESCDYLIGSIGRLEKPFVPSMISDLKNYVLQHKDKSFAFVMLGGTYKKSLYKTIAKEFSGISNLKLLFSGYIYPIPYKLLLYFDSFIGTAGSSRIPFKFGIPSITYDCTDLHPIGILGYNTNNTLHRSPNESNRSLNDLLDISLNLQHKEVAQIIDQLDYSSHFEAIEASDNSLKYFDIISIPLNLLEDKIRKILINILSPGVYTKIGNLKKSISPIIKPHC